MLDEDLANNSLYETLIEKYDTIPTLSINNIQALKCPHKIADLLQITPTNPILHLPKVAYDQNNLVFDDGDQYYRGDRYSYHIETNKQENETRKGVYSGT